LSVCFEEMKSLKLIDGQPDEIRIDGRIQFSSQSARRLGHVGGAIALFPNQRRSSIKAMGFISYHVVNQSLVVQFADHKIVCAGFRKSGSVFHL